MPNVRYLVCDTKSVYAPFATRTLRDATLVGDGPVWVHHHTSTAEGRLIDAVDRLDRHQALGMADDSHSKTDGAFSVRDPGIRIPTPLTLHV